MINSSSQTLRSRWRYWKGNLDFGFGLTQSTTDTSSVTLGFKAERKKSPTRLIIRSNYRFETEKQRGESRTTLHDQLAGFIKGEYDLSWRAFVFTSAAAEYDAIERLSIRGVPKLGIGYRIYKSESATFQIETGGAYVFERFFGGETTDFFAIPFGAETEIKLPYDITFHWRADYLPSVKEWTDDYLLSTEASLSVPIMKHLAFKASLTDDYDNQPAEDTNRNHLTTTLGLSVTF